MNRRSFLTKSALLLGGSLLGVNSFSEAFAFNGPCKNPFFKPVLSLIIDDIGFSRSRTKHFLDLGIPITFSILPRLPQSYSLAFEIHRQGHEIMLHQPMEPHGTGIDPGPGALYVGHDLQTIRRIMEENIRAMPFVTGVNNHMGSLFTECENKMDATLRVIKKNALFFVDSLTTYRSVACRTARKHHMTLGRRNIFLDNIPDESAILCQLRRLKKYALRHEQAIGIGHPYKETVRALKHFIKASEISGVKFVHVSALLYS